MQEYTQEINWQVWIADPIAQVGCVRARNFPEACAAWVNRFGDATLYDRIKLTYDGKKLHSSKPDTEGPPVCD